MYKIFLLLFVTSCNTKVIAQMSVEKLIEIGQSKVDNCKKIDIIIKEDGFYPVYYDIEVDKSLNEFWKEMNYQHSTKNSRLFVKFYPNKDYRLKFITNDYNEYRKWEKDMNLLKTYIVDHTSGMNFNWLKKSSTVIEEIEVGIDSDVNIIDGTHATVAAKIPVAFYFKYNFKN